MARFRAEMRHVYPRDGIAGEDPEQGAGVEPQQSLSRPQHGQRALLANHVEQNFALFLHGFRRLAFLPVSPRIMPGCRRHVTRL